MKSDECILVTGSAGLLGSRLIEYIIEKEDLQKDDKGYYQNIIGIDALEEWGNDHINTNIYNWQLDLSSKNAQDHLDKLFQTYNIQYIYHFASYAAEGLSYFMRTFNYMHNTIATANIIDACIKYNVKRLIYTSSVSIYGDSPCPFTEDMTPKPQDPYAISKMCCEQDIQSAGRYFGLDWTIIRPHNVFGRNQNMNDAYRNVIGIWMHQIREGNPISIYGDGSQIRCFTEMENILDPLWRCMQDSKASKQIINLGGYLPMSINELAEIVLYTTGASEKVYLEPRKEVKNTIVSPEKSILLLDYKDEVPIEKGIENMWKWYQKEPLKDWYKWNKFELEKNVYSYWKNC